MGAWDPGEFPRQPGQAHAHKDRKAWCSAQASAKNIGGPVALLPTDESSRPMIPEPPCRVTAGWGWRARRRPRGAGVPVRGTSPRPLLSVVHVRCAPLHCGLETPRPPPDAPQNPAGTHPAGGPSARAAPGRAAAAARTGAPGPATAGGGRRAARYANDRGAGEGRLPARDKSPGRGGARRRSRCLPGAGRALRFCARPPHARPPSRPPAPGKHGPRGRGRGAAAGEARAGGQPARATTRARVRASPRSTRAVPGRAFSVGTRDPAPPRRPPGAGQVASPQLLRVGPVCPQAISSRDREELRW